MSNASILEPSKPLQTRAELKRQLLSAVPQGEELNFLQQAQQQLTESRDSLHALRTERAKLMRQISIRKRKMQDWKSKIPRIGQPTHEAAEAVLKRIGDAPCHAIAVVENVCGDVQTLRFEKPFRRGLSGLEGFEKAWIILDAPLRGAVANGLALLLVDLVCVDFATGLVHLTGLEESCKGSHVLDIKPYLAYCEAFPNDADAEDGNLLNVEQN